MGIPVIAAQGTPLADGTRGTSIVPLPAGIVANDLVIVFLYIEDNTGASTPPDWTKVVFSPPLPSSGTSPFLTLHVYWTRALGSFSGSVTINHANTTSGGFALRISGAVTTGSPIEVLASGNGSGQATTPSLSGSTAAPNRLALLIGAHNSAAVEWTPPPGWTEVFDPATANSIGTFSQNMASAGTISNVQATGSVSATAIVAALLTVHDGSVAAKQGSAGGSWSFSGSAVGKRRPRGTASRTWSFVGTASGSSSASAQFPWVGSAAWNGSESWSAASGVPAAITSPERGWFFYTETHERVDNTGRVALSQATLTSQRALGRTQVFRYYVMEKFLGTDTIDQAYKDFIAADIVAARAAGVKLIPRFTYSTSGVMTPPYNADPPVARVLTHIQQLAPVLNAGADVIDAIQAGFIGMWGEWYYTDNFGDLGTVTTQQWADRKAVVDALLSNLDSRIFVLIRYIGAMRRLLDAEPANVAYVNRIGHHNDAFLAETNDWGTYDTFSASYSAAQNRAWIENRNQTGRFPMGGETANPNSPRSDFPTAKAELSTYRWSFLNPEFHPTVLNSWGQAGRDEVSSRLGYRFKISNVAASESAGVVTLAFDLANDGWAAPYRNRPVKVDMISGGTVVTRDLASIDVRTWTPGIRRVSVSFASPTLAGTYSLHLRIVDASASLQSNALYSVRTESPGAYDTATGRNDLNATITSTTVVRSGAASGAWAFSGSALGRKVSRGSAVGNWTFAGPAAGKKSPRGVAASTWTFVGTATGRKLMRGTASAGVWTFVGTAAGVRPAVNGKFGSATGLWTFVGTATGRELPKAQAAGTWTFAGVSAGRRAPRGVAAASWTFVGTSTGRELPKAQAVGTWAFVGTSVGRRAPKASAAGTWTMSGAGLGRKPGGGAVFANWTFVGTASGARASRGVVSGSWTFVGAASGRITRRGAASASWVISGAASGAVVRRASSSGVWAFVGTSSGRVQRRGLAAGTHTWVATTAIGYRPIIGQKVGIATGTWTFVGTSSGLVQRRGLAAGTHTWNATAVGSRPVIPAKLGSATGSWVFSGVAVGKETPKAAASGLWTFAGAGFAKRTPKGSATVGVWTFIGASAGRRTSRGLSSGTWTMSGSGVGVTTSLAARSGVAGGAWSFASAAGGKRVASGESMQPQIIPDPGFEEGSRTGLPSVMSPDSDNPRSGNLSMRVLATPGAVGLQMLDTAVPVLPGQVWVISAWRRTTADYNGTTNNGKLRLAQGNNVVLDVATWGVGTTWAKRTVIYTVPLNGTVMSLTVQLQADHTVGTLWIDDFEMRNVNADVPHPSWAFRGTATGKKYPAGESERNLTWAGIGVGKRRPKAAAVGFVDWAATAPGRKRQRGTVAGTWHFTSSARGRTPIIGRDITLRVGPPRTRRFNLTLTSRQLKTRMGTRTNEPRP